MHKGPRLRELGHTIFPCLLVNFIEVRSTLDLLKSHFSSTKRFYMLALYTQLLHSNVTRVAHQHACSPPQTGVRKAPRLVQMRIPPSTGCLRKRDPERAFGTDITARFNNGICKTILGGSFTHFKCSKCQIYLCVQGNCWHQYHHSIGVSIAVLAPKRINSAN
jgi:hypothetical protein